MGRSERRKNAEVWKGQMILGIAQVDAANDSLSVIWSKGSLAWEIASDISWTSRRFGGPTITLVVTGTWLATVINGGCFHELAVPYKSSVKTGATFIRQKQLPWCPQCMIDILVFRVTEDNTPTTRESREEKNQNTVDSK